MLRILKDLGKSAYIETIASFR